MTDSLPCRSIAVICSSAVACQGVEDGHEFHTATVNGGYSATDTYGADRAGRTRIVVMWTAPVLGADLRTPVGMATVRGGV